MDHVAKIPQHAALRAQSHGAVPGGAGVDVGCGHGLAVAELVGLGYNAVGIDSSETMIQAARRRFPSCSFTRAGATALPFPDGSLRWYRAERMYLHIHDPLPALREARRVLAPGGKVILIDNDLDTTAVSAASGGLTRTIIGALTDSLPAGRAGTLLAGQLAAAGFVDVAVTPATLLFREIHDMARCITNPAAELAVATGVVTEPQARAWLADLEKRATDNRFVLSTTLFINTARVP